MSNPEMYKAIRARQLPVGVVALVVFLVGGLVQTVRAQDGGWVEWARQTIENDYAISGGELVIGGEDIVPSYTVGDAPVAVSAAEEGFPFTVDEYLHFEHPTAEANWYDAGPRYLNNLAVEAGDAGLIILLLRGDPITGAASDVQLTLENYGEWTGAGLSQVESVVSDWELKLIPVTFSQSLPEQDMQFVINYGQRSMELDLLPPIVLNFGTTYSQELLQYLIDNEGLAPLLANFTLNQVRGVPPFTVEVDASISTPAGGITSYAWDFGDGTTGTGATASHTYTTEGHYDITLTVSNANAESDDITKRVIVFDGIGLPETPLEIPFTEAAPAIDGTIDDAWSAAPAVRLQNWVEGLVEPTSEADLSAEARALWDTEYLYVLYEVQDDALYNDSPNTYEDDGVDLFIDGGNEKTTSYDANDAQFEFGYAADTTTGNAVDNGLDEGVEFITLEVTGGYVVEARIPLDNLDIVPLPGTRIGIDFMVNDDDTQGNLRQTKLAWFSLNDFAFRDVSGLATAEFVGGQGSILSPQFTANRQQILSDLPVTFDASGSLAPEEITGYAWNLGDGTQATGPVVEHTFAAPGTYVVTMTITYGDGLTAVREREFTVIDGTGTVDKPLRIPLADAPPTIDGVLDPSWESNAASIYLTETSTGTPRDASDLSATVYSMWDFDNLYIFYDVKDDTLNSDSENAWQDDSPEFMLDFGWERCEQCNDENDRQYTFGVGHDEIQGNVVERSPDHGVEWVIQTNDEGYTLEASIPWSSASDQPVQMNQRIGFEPNANDADVEGDTRDARLTWIDMTNNSYQYANTLGSAILVETLEVAAEEASELPAVFAIESVYPNPFNPSTTAVLQVRQTGAYDLKVYNVLGQLVMRHEIAVQQPGRVEVGLDMARYASGMYLISIEHQATGKTASARAMLIK